jgi:hypothetical protein
VTSSQNLGLDLTRPQPLSNRTKIRRPVAPDACDAMATNAAVRLEYVRSPFTRIRRRREYHVVPPRREDHDQVRHEENAEADCIPASTHHLHPIFPARFGSFPSTCVGGSVIPARNRPGVAPVNRRKSVVNWLWLVNPHR